MSVNTPVVGALIDISVPISPQMPIYPGDPGVVFESALDMGCGGVANVTHIHIGSQTGTHFDTPHHILNNGVTIEQIPLEQCYGPALVIEIPEEIQAIDLAILKTFDLSGCTRLLLKTRNSGFWQTHPESFVEHFAALTGDGAEYLASQGVQLVGIDYLSVELFGSSGLKAHKALLEQNILILEGINLASVDPGRYTLIAFPLKYHGLDGAPTRAVLVRNG
jgi:arylformamidase